MKCAVLGDPIAHSLSPILHKAGYAALGLDWTYKARRVASGGLEEFLAGCGPEWRGLSLTMPLKREAMALVDTATDRARLAGAANTLVLDDGTIHGDNTDIPGAVAAIRERYDGRVLSATILGGGATAASAALALCDLGATDIRLLVRDADRAADTVAAIHRHPSAPMITVGSLADDFAEGEVLVSTIPAEAQTPDLVSRCDDVEVTFEVLYHPWPTPLARATNGVLVGGLDLLVHQAAIQFSLFTGHEAPLAEMRAAGEAELAARTV